MPQRSQQFSQHNQLSVYRSYSVIALDTTALDRMLVLRQRRIHTSCLGGEVGSEFPSVSAPPAVRSQTATISVNKFAPHPVHGPQQATPPSSALSRRACPGSASRTAPEKVARDRFNTASQQRWYRWQGARLAASVSLGRRSWRWRRTGRTRPCRGGGVDARIPCPYGPVSDALCIHYAKGTLRCCCNFHWIGETTG
jgi:hypothetical protein